MSENKKPRICEVLGVEVGEEWTIRNWPDDGMFRFKDEETLQSKHGDSSWKTNPFMGNTLIRLINHPENIIHSSRWTADDIADAKAVRRLWSDAITVDRHPEWRSVYISNYEYNTIGDLPGMTFPTLKPGESVALGEILEAEE